MKILLFFYGSKPTNGMAKDHYKEFVLKRDRYRCKICNTNKQMVIAHHIIPKKFGGTDKPENRITLCTTCHRAAELGLLGAASLARIYEIGKNEKWFQKRIKELGIKTNKNPHQKGPYWTKKSIMWKEIKIPRELFDNLVMFRRKNSKKKKLPTIHHAINYLLERSK